MYRECVQVYGEREFFVIVTANDFLLLGAGMNDGCRSGQHEMVVQVVVLGRIQQIYLSVQGIQKMRDQGHQRKGPSELEVIDCVNDLVPPSHSFDCLQ